MYDRFGRKINVPEEVEDRPSTPLVPLSSPEALYALTYMIGDHQLVDRVVNRFQSWESLAQAGPGDLAFAVGTWAAQLRIPSVCPPMPEMTDRVKVVSRYQKKYPRSLAELETAPVLLYVLGELTKDPILAIGGTHFPTQAGIDVTLTAVRAAVKSGITVAAAFDTGCGHIALQETVSLSGKALAVASSDLEKLGSSSVLSRRILDNGGAVISEYGPGEQWVETRTFTSSRLVAALGSGVLLPEFGSHEAGGSYFAKAAISLERYLIVPKPFTDAEMPLPADGTSALAKPRNFSARLYGTNSRIESRMRAGYPPADALVATPDEMMQAITLACAPKTRR